MPNLPFQVFQSEIPNQESEIERPAPRTSQNATCNPQLEPRNAQPVSLDITWRILIFRSESFNIHRSFA